MAEANDIAAWILLFLGLYSLAAAIGEWRNPRSWMAMVAQFQAQAGLRYLTGIVLIALGAAVYLVTPWQPGDWLGVLVTVLGGVMALEGLAMIAFGDVWMRFAGRMLSAAPGLWVIASALIGAAAIAAALLRL